VDVIISDDGLQHTGLVRWPAREGGRDVEFVVRDQRGEGNGFLLPAGPLREPHTRERDATLIMGSAASLTAKADEYFLGRRAFTLRPHFGRPYQLNNPQAYKTLDDMNLAYPGKSGRTPITAVAAIGNPQRFFGDLEKHGLKIKGIGLPDHSSFTGDFFKKIDADCILITEKDAVKCKGIMDARIWVIPMHLNIPEGLLEWLQTILHRPDPNRYTL
jgi:tetraacyldisaccharide 4'-kinase